MNKVKFLMSAAAIVAVVGGALAFKASKLPSANVYCSTFQSGSACQKVLFTTDNDIDPTGNPCSNGLFYTQNTCPSTTAFTTQNDGTHTIQKVKAVTE